MLKTAGFSLPRKIHMHGFLTVDGEKMSKTKGTFVRAATYLNHLDPAYLRYYYASKLAAGARRPGFEPRRVRHQGQLRPGWQGGQPGQPHGQIRPGDRPGDRLSRRRRPVRPGGRRGRGDRRGLRSVRLQPGHAAGDGAGRSGEPIRRRRRTVEAAQQRRAGRRLAGRPARSRSTCSGSWPSISRRCCRDCACQTEELLGSADHALGRRPHAAGGQAGQSVQPHDETRRADAGRSHDRRKPTGAEHESI